VNRFSDIVPLVLTPLTPIHIGCGEEFEPPNYVIDGGVLYPFNPTALAFDQKDREDLRQRANRSGLEAILAVQQFFHTRRSDCRRLSRLGIPVAAGVADWYEDRIGRVVQSERGGRDVCNKLAVERTAHHLYTGIPYLPGSSIKGSARTGWLNDVDQVPSGPRDPTRPPADNANRLEQEILEGSFSSDPFRLVEFSDAAGADLKSRVVFAVDRRKRPRPDGKQRDDLSVRREAIAGGQFRAAQGEIRFKVRPASSDSRHAPRLEKCIGDFAALARACNRFYRGRLEPDLEVLTALGEAQWTGAFKSLIAALKPALDGGGAMLLRVGRHSGAESVTLDRHRWIRIMEGRGKAHWAPAATTIWLAAEREDSGADLRPFGWLLLERADDLLSNDHLRRWCDAEVNASRSQSAPRGSPARAFSADEPKQPVASPLRRGATVIYQGEAATIRDIDGTEARIEFEGGDTDWVPLDKLTLS
jgi:CRISPR-associated protein Csm5